jgi:ubiquitin-activating enzyme E1-like protein 2
VRWAILKHRAYFNLRILALLKACPLDMKTEDGTPFWAPPKRPPVPILFSSQSESHLNFIRAAACLRAWTFSVDVPAGLTNEKLAGICEELIPSLPPPKVKAAKKISEEEEKAEAKAAAPAAAAASGSAEAQPVTLTEEQYEREISQLVALAKSQANQPPIRPSEFEKDDDSNHHVDYVWAASNLRAANYSIAESDRLTVKRIAGRIIPAIATTTAAVSGLVAGELVKILIQRKTAEPYRNAFLNLALPLFSFSEPAPPAKTKLAEGVYFTVWDSWEVHDTAEGMTLQNLVDHFQERFKLSLSAVIQGQRMVYISLMPAHALRLPKLLRDLLAKQEGQKFVDLVITFSDAKGDDVETPPIRFHFY